MPFAKYAKILTPSKVKTKKIINQVVNEILLIYPQTDEEEPDEANDADKDADEPTPESIDVIDSIDIGLKLSEIVALFILYYLELFYVHFNDSKYKN